MGDETDMSDHESISRECRDQSTDLGGSDEESLESLRGHSLEGPSPRMSRSPISTTDIGGSSPPPKKRRFFNEQWKETYPWVR